jgi:hypothetical protein
LFAKAKVGQLDVAVCVNKYVFWLEITVHNT